MDDKEFLNDMLELTQTFVERVKKDDENFARLWYLAKTLIPKITNRLKELN